MNAERWRAVGELFERALPLPSGERTILVERTCREDDELRLEVLSLLASHNVAAGGFVQQRIRSAVASFPPAGLADERPARVGPYRLVRELGRGGMGVVYLAERDDDPYHSRVAVKLVRPGMDTEFILARFRRERQTLARLQHPNISRLLDGGTTEGGLPYIVMEYIDGPTLTEFARNRKLSVEERIRMFLDACSAVDYAHRNFIIHRDLKPGNILVGADGVPKLLDFGICKLLRADAVPGMETVEVLMTPNFASPEQLRGEPVTTLSDVYSLGAVLFQLLTGECPRRFATLTPQAIEEVLSRGGVVRPSTAVEDKALVRQLEGDLDNILMRALEVEPPRRYESAAQFADDLRRYLDQEPVHARPPTLFYRAIKFVRRNRVRVVAAVAVFIALAAGLIVSSYEARIAVERLRQVLTLSDKLIFDLHDAVRDLPGSTPARQMIVQRGLEYLDSAVDSAKGDPSAELALAKAYLRLGDVQGYAHEANLGDTAGALARYGSARLLLEDSIRRSPGDLDARTERLVLYGRIGTIQARAGHFKEALETLQAGIVLGAPFASSQDSRVRSALAELWLESSGVRRNMNDNDGALRDAAEALSYQRGAAPPPVPRR